MGILSHFGAFWRFCHVFLARAGMNARYQAEKLDRFLTETDHFFRIRF
jgi:hypothetical protein